VFPLRDTVVDELVAAFSDGELPADALDDWRMHPDVLAWIAQRVGVRGRILDVGAGRFPAMSCGFSRLASVIAIDRRMPAERADNVVSVCADVHALPFVDGAFDGVVSRMFFGAPVSQMARRRVGSGDPDAHGRMAHEVETRIWSELHRVSAGRALQLHFVLE